MSSTNKFSSELQTDSTNGNFPGEYDSTSSGGYGTATNVWSQKSQRGFDNTKPTTEGANEKTEVGQGGRQGADGSNTGLIDQSLSGGNLSEEIKDAKQGGEGSWPRETQIL